MAYTLPTTSDLYRALLKEGFQLPDECADVELLMPVDGIFQLKYTCNVTGEKLAQLGRALTAIGEGRIE